MQIDQIRKGMRVMVTRGPFAGCAAKVLGIRGRRIAYWVLGMKPKTIGTCIPSLLQQFPSRRARRAEVLASATRRDSVAKARRLGYEDYVGGFLLNGNRYTKGSPQWKAWRAGFLEARQEGHDFSVG